MKILAARSTLTFVIVIGMGTLSQPATAAVQVVDNSNLTHNTITSAQVTAQHVQQIEQYTTQMQQYMTQLQQYDNMLKNTEALPQQTWSQVQGNIDGLTKQMQGLDAMSNSAGSIESYLADSGDTNTYASRPCFNGTPCTPEQAAAIWQANATVNAGVKSATDSQIKALQQQQSSLTADAANVQQLQSSASGASGQKAAIDAANQLAASQANQLLQIRALLVAAHTAQAAQLEQQNAQDAQEAAIQKKLTKVKPVGGIAAKFYPGSDLGN